MKEEVRSSRAASRKRKRLLRLATTILLIVSLVGVIVFAAFIDSKKQTALPESDNISTEEADGESETVPTEETTEETADEELVYITTPYTKVYADDRVTVLYEADLGDRFERLEAVSGFVKLQLNDRTTGWVTEERVTEDSVRVTDEEVKRAWQVVVPTATASALDWLGQDVASVRSTLGAPASIQRDQVNEYHFYSGFFLMVRDQHVKAIDWDRQMIVTPELEASSSQSTGSWYEGETLQLKLFPYNGVMRVRIEQK